MEKTKSDNDLTKCEKVFQDTQDTLELLNDLGSMSSLINAFRYKITPALCVHISDKRSPFPR